MPLRIFSTRRFLLGAWVALGLASCKGNLGGVRINVTLVNDTRTRCLQAWARTATSTSYSEKVPRLGSTYVFGVQGSHELEGEVTVGVNLFTSADCSNGHYRSDTRLVTIKPNTVEVVNIDFVFDDGDGGSDGGFDAGCDPALCTTPPVCHQGPGTCVQGACSYPTTLGASCGDGGVCNAAGQCVSNVCAVFDAGASCDDGLVCTFNDTCDNGVCAGTCPPPAYPQCGHYETPVVCEPDAGCRIQPFNINGNCDRPGPGRCDDGGTCLPWFPFSVSNFPDDVTRVAQPTADWVANNLADGGACVIDTGTTPPGPRDAGDCGFRGVGQVFPQPDGGELALFAATSLTVPSGVELRFVGARPAVVAIFGDATIHGTLNAAAATGAEAPAGTGSPECTLGDESQDEAGGLGGGYRTPGGKGGNSGLTSMVNGAGLGVPLRGGCRGGRGGGPSPGDGGMGGGALQLTVAGTLTVGDGGILTVSGAGGLGGTGDRSGGGGGGSGGTLFLEASDLVLVNCALTANGGGGGQGGKSSGGSQVRGAAGDDGSPDSGIPASGGASNSAGGSGGTGAAGTTMGGNGSNGNGMEGGGGGGGGVGLLRLRVVGGTCRTSGAVLSGERPMNPCP
jgi:hypothetical protein